MLSARARTRAAGRAKSRSDGRLLRRKACVQREALRQQYVRVKKENGAPVDSCGELIDLASSGDENKCTQQIAGRFNVRCIETDEGTSVELIEFLSDAASCNDDDNDSEPSEAETIDLACVCSGAKPLACTVRRGSTIYVEAPPLTVDLTRPKDGGSGELLCEYEQIYVDLAQSSSSDDYESTDSSDAAEEQDSGGEGSDADVPRAFVPRRRVVPSSAAAVGKKELQKKIYADVTRLEMRKPWLFVYRCLDIPFESTPRTDSCGLMFERWDDFWRDHGQAVWERMYWKPVDMACEEYRQRHNRQSRAMKAFRHLADDLHQKFGLKLIELVKAKPHSGWWYRSKRPVDLVRLRCQDSRLYALHISRFRERWPFGVRHVRLHCKSWWCLPELASTAGKANKNNNVETPSDPENDQEEL